MTANDLDRSVQERMLHLDIWSVMPKMELVGEGQWQEVLDQTGKANRYYQWLAALMGEVRPKQVVELGAAAGVSTIILSHFAPQAKIISVDNDPQAWRWMGESPNVVKVLGDDLDLSIYKDDLSLTDVWFIDSMHEEGQLRKELELYKPFFKKGAVVVLDDIRINEGMGKVWEELEYDKCENTVPNHYSGFGFFIV